MSIREEKAAVGGGGWGIEKLWEGVDLVAMWAPDHIPFCKTSYLLHQFGLSPVAELVQVQGNPFWSVRSKAFNFHFNTAPKRLKGPNLNPDTFQEMSQLEIDRQVQTAQTQSSDTPIQSL